MTDKHELADQVQTVLDMIIKDKISFSVPPRPDVDPDYILTRAIEALRQPIPADEVEAKLLVDHMDLLAERDRMRDALENAPPIGSYQGKRQVNPDAYWVWRNGKRREALKGED